MGRKLLALTCLFVGMLCCSQAKAAGVAIDRAYYLTAQKTSVAYSGRAWLSTYEYSPLIGNFYSISSNSTTRNRKFNAYWADVNYNNGDWRAEVATVPRPTAATVYVSLWYYTGGVRYAVGTSLAVR